MKQLFNKIISKFKKTDPWIAQKASLMASANVGFYADGSEAKHKATGFDVVLENTYHEFPNHRDILLPMVAKTYPNLIAHELIGVQPVKALSQHIHVLSVGYKPKETDTASLTPIDIATSYQGVAEGRLHLQILKMQPTYTEKLLSMHYSSSVPGVSDEDLRAAIYAEYIAEMDLDVLSNLRSLAGTPSSTFSMMNASPNTTFVGDVHAALAILINRQANLIASRTRRGAGNKVVVSPTALTILQSATTSAFARTTESINHSTGVIFVGKLNQSINVYIDPYASDKVPVLVSYKGNEIDAPSFWSPYLSVKLDGARKISTEGGYYNVDNNLGAMTHAADYLGLVAIDAETLSFI